MSISQHVFTLVVAGLALGAIFVSDIQWLRAATDEEAMEIFKEGVELYKRGRHAEALVKFEQVIQLKPSFEAALAMRDEVGINVLLDMVAKGGHDRDVAMKILTYVQYAVEKKRRDPEEIKALVKDLESVDPQTVWLARLKLIASGEHAVPYLIEPLKDDRNDRLRVNCIITLTKIGGDAALALVEAMDSPNAFLRMNAAIILGNIKDIRGIAALRRACENPREESQVRDYANEASEKILASLAGTTPWTQIQNMFGKSPTALSAVEWYHFLAEWYYKSYPFVIRKWENMSIVWKWDDEKDTLTYRTVPPFAFNEELAEEACFDALALNEEYFPIWPLLTCVSFAQVIESAAVVESVKMHLEEGTVDGSMAELIERRAAAERKADAFGKMAGKRHLINALQKALDDNMPEVAVSILEALESVAGRDDLPLMPLPPRDEAVMKPEELTAWQREKAAWAEENARRLGQPILNALNYKDKRVQYAAARAILKFDPRQDFPARDKVMPTAALAIGESGEYIVLVINPDAVFRNKIQAELKRLGCYTIDAVSAEEGLLRAKRFPTKDLIMIDSKLARSLVYDIQTPTKSETQDVFKALKEDYRTGEIPLVMTGTESEIQEARKIYGAAVDSYLTLPVSGADLESMLDRLFEDGRAKSRAKARADRISREVVMAIAALNPRDTIFSFEEVVPALIGVLAHRPDEIRLPAMDALQKIRPKEAIKPLADTFADKRNSREVRIAAARTMGQIFKATGEPPPGLVFNILRDGLTEGDDEIELAASEALGNASLNASQLAELARIKRMQIIKELK